MADSLAIKSFNGGTKESGLASDMVPSLTTPSVVAVRNEQQMECEDGSYSLLDVVPEELLLQIFSYFGADVLVVAMGVSSTWYRIANTDSLWHELCVMSHRVKGDLTQRVIEQASKTRSWKQIYFWIKNSDLESHSVEEWKELLRDMDFDSTKKDYLHARALEENPNSSTLYQVYADFLVDRPDEYGSWDTAESFFKNACELSKKGDLEGEKRYHAAFIIFRYAYFLAANRSDLEAANNYYLQLFSVLPPNAWTIERYAVFLTEYLHQHTKAETMFQHLAHLSPTSSSLSSYAFFKWQIKRHVNEAGDLFKRACDFDRDRIYFYVFFIARQFHDKRSASMILQASALKLYIDGNPDGDPEAERTEYADSIFSLALAYHQIPMAEEAEKLYRQHLTICTKHNIYTLSNLAELLLHSIGNFEEAKQLYQKALEKAGDHNETIEFALVGLQLASGDREGGLIKLNKLIDSSYIKASKNALTECAIVNYIHCYPDSKKSALKLVKELLVTEQVRPKLILMFDANLKWARAQNLPDYNLMEKICAVYNCEYFVEVLDEFSEWRQIEVPAPPPDLGLAPAH